MKPRLNFKNYFIALACLPLLGMCWSVPALAGCELAKLLASDGTVNDYFGYSVGISGDTAIIGAYGDDDNGNNAGAAYIFRFDGSNWGQQAKLLASDGTDNDFFGGAVSIWGDTAVIGAIGDDDNGNSAGAAYIFRFNNPNWVQEAKLLASDGAASDYFGISVGVWDDTVVIGAERDDDNGYNSGSAYIFRFNDPNWVEEDKLLASDGEAYDYFGNSVSIWGESAIVGAYYDDDNGNNSGSAYVFRFNDPNWNQEDKLLASDGAANDYFGNSVGIWNEAAVIGAYGDDSSTGSAYIFRFDDPNWNQENKLFASDGAAGDYFGQSVGISDDKVVIGADYNDANEPDSGSAYVFRFNDPNWNQENKLFASDGTTGDYFGQSVGISGNRTIIGTYYDDDNGNNSGSAYIFGLSLYSGDLDFDNDVDFVDYSLFAEYWLETGCGPCACDGADITGNSQVDKNDLKELCANWLAGK
jgi:hypothetical protein